MAEPRASFAFLKSGPLLLGRIHRTLSNDGRFRIGLNALYWRPDAMGGTQTYLLRLVEALRRVAPQHEYVLFLNAEGAEYGAPEFDGLEVDVCPWQGRKRPLRMLWEHTQLPNQAEKRGVDVLHSLGYIAPSGLTMPAVVTVIDLVHYEFPQQLEMPKRLLWHWLFSRSLSSAQHIITISSSVARELGERFPFTRSLTTAVPLGVDPQWGMPGPTAKSDTPYLLAVASAAPHKNLHTAVRALARLVPTTPSLTLRLVGMRTATTSALAQLAQSLGVADRVHFTGRISDAELAAHYRGAAALVFPSLYEGFGLPILEAMAAGCPVVASDRPAISEVAGDAALQFPAEDDAALADTLQRLLKDDALQTSLRARGRQRAAAFTWEKTALGTLAVYERVLRAEGSHV